MCAQLRQDHRALDAPAHAPLPLTRVEPRRGDVYLRPHAARPGAEREPERLGVGDPGGIVAAVVQQVPDHPPPGPLRQREHIAERVDALVVLDHEPGPRSVGQRRGAAYEAVGSGLDTAGGAANVEDDHGLVRQVHRVEKSGLDLELRRGGGPHGLVLRVQNGVLAGMGREADAERAASEPTAASSSVHSSTCPWNWVRSGWLA